MDVLGTLIGGLIAGIIIGPLARLVLPGKQNLSVGMTILLGAIGAFIGGFVYEAFGGTETDGIDWIRLAIQVAVAALAVLIYGAGAGLRTTTCGGNTLSRAARTAPHTRHEPARHPQTRQPRPRDP